MEIMKPKIGNSEVAPKVDNDVLDFMETQSEQSAKKIFERYKMYIENIIRSFTNISENIEDISQEVFAKIFNSLKSGGYKEENFKAWITRITKNCCLDFYNKKKRRPTLADSGDELLQDLFFNNLKDPELNPVDLIEYENFRTTFKEAIEKLPDKQKSAINYFFEGYKYEEISDLLGFSLGSIKTLIHRAKASLRESLSALYPNINFDFLPKEKEDETKPKKEKQFRYRGKVKDNE